MSHGQLVLACAIGTMAWTVAAHAQQSNTREAMSRYIDEHAGMSLDAAVARAVQQEPSLRAVRADVEVARALRQQAELRRARGTDARRFPWGEATPTAQLATFGRTAPSANRGGLSPVGSHPEGRSPLGVDDLSGNAAEWVADWYSESFPRTEVRNPQGPQSGPGRVVRGGGWQDPPERLAVTKRFFSSAQNRSDDKGFRCAVDAAK